MRRLFIIITILMLTLTGWTQTKDLILGGELSNSAATSIEDIDEVMPRMKALGLNTVLVPAYWEFLESKEGNFDFTLIDRTIQQARDLQLKVVFLWFGAWKNSMSCYAPLWFKQDTKRFPRAKTQQGKPLEIACCFSEQVFQADNKAFEALVKHISETGSDVVTMIQVENEIGMLEDARDHSKLADEVYKKGVPQELLSYLKKNQEALHPWLKERLKGQQLTANSKQPSWAQVFGNDIYTDEIFMAYYYAKYVGRLCETARRYTQIPLYVNAAMNSRGRKPGQYPSAGPLAHLIDLWHCGAPQLLCLAPDIYDTGFKGWAAQYALPDNRLFIPESRCCENSGVRAMYAFGEHDALGFSPFAIDQASPKETESVTKAYSLLRQLSNINSQKSWGLLFDQEDKEHIIENDGMVITCRHYYTLPWDPRATDGSTWPEGGAILLKLANNDYLLAGTGVVITFALAYENVHAQQQTLGEDGFVAAGDAAEINKSKKELFSGSRKGIASVDEVNIDKQGQMHYLRRLNGDQDHQGRHVRIACGEWKILHVRLYDYK
ncbi:MAG: DUF5597 domain-containing protein [Prevotella sp.]|nr:DUF5597 domain-containing protein [Prevotella sp.]